MGTILVQYKHHVQYNDHNVAAYSFRCMQTTLVEPASCYNDFAMAFTAAAQQLAETHCWQICDIKLPMSGYPTHTTSVQTGIAAVCLVN